MSFNHYKIKRAAHTLSRQNSDQRWNLFRHLSWDRRDPQRRGTWDGGQLEAQPENVEQEQQQSGSPITHASTAPGFMSRRNGREAEGGGPDVKEQEVQEAGERSNQGSGDTTFVESQPGSAPETQDGLRARGNRRLNTASDTAKEEEPEEPEEPKDKPKKGKEPLFKHLTPKEPFTFANQLQRTFLSSWINILLFAAPVGIAINFVPGMNGIAIFVANFIAIIPLAAMLSFATEEIALRTGETLGGLLNATFGNAVELIVAIMALAKGKVLIVQTSLIGSILSNLLLVMGMCFFFGGLRRREQYFNTTVAQTAASLLALAVSAVIVPTVFDKMSNTADIDVADLSRGTAVILLVVYGGYLFFQLKTHQDVFAEESRKVPMRPSKHALPEGAIARGMVQSTGLVGAHGFSGDHKVLNKVLQSSPAKDDEEPEDPKLHFLVALGALAGSTVIIAFCAEFMVDGISAVTAGGVVSEEFVGLILLPIVGNAAEHVTAVSVGIKDKMDLAIGVAVGSSMQVALLLIPLMVVIGWGMGNVAMTLSFDVFQVAVMFVAVLLVNYLISDGKSHWLEGLLLMCLYCIIAVCSWWYPASGVAG